MVALNFVHSGPSWPLTCQYGQNGSVKPNYANGFEICTEFRFEWWVTRYFFQSGPRWHVNVSKGPITFQCGHNSHFHLWSARILRYHSILRLHGPRWHVNVSKWSMKFQSGHNSRFRHVSARILRYHLILALKMSKNDHWHVTMSTSDNKSAQIMAISCSGRNLEQNDHTAI